VAALAFPERVARRRGPGAYVMVGGTAAEVAGGGLGDAEWIAVAVADRGAGRASARVRVAAVVDEATAREAAGSFLEAYEEVVWRDGDVVARSVQRLGAVELSTVPLRSPNPEAVREALLTGLRGEGIGLLRWSRGAQELRMRMAFAHRVLGGAWPDVSEEALLERAPEWLGPELATARRRSDLERIDAANALQRLLPWATGDAARFAELVPERIALPGGARVRVDYSGERPVLAAKLQEFFGLHETPRIAGEPVLLHLLSPAGRPAAVTSDLPSFWHHGYRAVRADLRGRYPKHPWPDHPEQNP
jgi:ATP-dependent helicase HrpB